MQTEAHVKRETCAPLRGPHSEAADGHRKGHGHEAGARPQAKATGNGQATTPRDGSQPHGNGPCHGDKATSHTPGFRSGRPIPKADRPHTRDLPSNVDKPRRDGPHPETKVSARTNAATAPMLTSRPPDFTAGPMLTMLTWRSA